MLSSINKFSCLYLILNLFIEEIMSSVQAIRNYLKIIFSI